MVIIKEECQYEWNQTWNSSALKIIKSPLFPSEQRNFKYKLDLDIDFLWQDIHLQIIEIPPGYVDISFKFSIISDCFKAIDDKRSFRNLLNPTKLLIASHKNIFTHNAFYSLKLKLYITSVCTMEDSLEPPETDIQNQSSLSYQEISDQKIQLERLLQLLLNDRDFKDLKIKVGSEELDVHKCVLAVTSPVFRAGLTHDMLEKTSDCIEIKDFEMDTVRLMINFLYKRDINIPDCNCALELLKISDCYDIQDLKKFCEKYLKKIMSKDNVLEIFLSAEMNNHEDLKNCAMNYFLENFTPCNSCDFRKMAELRPKLIAELMSKMTEKFANKYFNAISVFSNLDI